jgi:hypothetical protein
MTDPSADQMRSEPTPTAELSHVRADGSAHMVDVSAKDVTDRSATATATVVTRPDVSHASSTARCPRARSSAPPGSPRSWR